MYEKQQQVTMRRKVTKNRKVRLEGITKITESSEKTMTRSEKYNTPTNVIWKFVEEEAGLAHVPDDLSKHPDFPKKQSDDMSHEEGLHGWHGERKKISA